ncbi:hypothetical protein K437DRAFT_265162 [Tilletiaria anomala UBC 951]|uniref:GLTSCR protein conserved domain-containing protein n=1 Tax=Tilletiaria anomala (strain ATCC 24038 / CBS 436.72 / UBC 951) TaxID=1037660 RepID=A0A066VEL2_TILAU|nr:uncharacterized protein K437DRAFT_265162 [Tilletiaria anomala UBC 951]KDN37030.1 hypothetical protein K437DRAFT_265162 [Tilletiaria anomala UBC 951]
MAADVSSSSTSAAWSANNAAATAHQSSVMQSQPDVGASPVAVQKAQAQATTSLQQHQHLVSKTNAVEPGRFSALPSPGLMLDGPADKLPGIQAQLHNLQASATNNFAAALEADQRAALQPTVDTPFTSTEDIIRRLLPFHVFQIPSEDLDYVINQHKQQHRNRSLKRKRRRIETPVEAASASATSEATPTAAPAPLLASAQEHALQSESFADASAAASTSCAANSQAEVGPSSVAPLATILEPSSNEVNGQPSKKKTRLRVRLPAAPSGSSSEGKGKDRRASVVTVGGLNGYEIASEKGEDGDSASKKDQTPQPPPEPEPFVPWWEADLSCSSTSDYTVGFDHNDSFPSMIEAIDLFDRHASISERVMKLLIGADGGYTRAQGQVFLETQLDRYNLEYERELLQQDTQLLVQARTRWETFAREHPEAAKAALPPPPPPPPPHQPQPQMQPPLARLPPHQPSPASTLASRTVQITDAATSAKSTDLSSQQHTKSSGAQPQPHNQAPSSAGAQGGSSASARSSIPNQPIPLQIPLSVLPRLTALGMNAIPAPHLVPALAASVSMGAGAGAGTDSGTIDASSYLRSIGPATAPRSAPPDQREPALLMGITQTQPLQQQKVQASSASAAATPALHVLHISVRLDKLLPHQLSGLAAIMSGLQAQAQAQAHAQKQTKTKAQTQGSAQAQVEAAVNAEAGVADAAGASQSQLPSQPQTSAAALNEPVASNASPAPGPG